ncbi:MAG TPA: DMT family transporter [Stellaceae bacterium]|nr:DMT family transporter [Stellaceae bacterium]
MPAPQRDVVVRGIFYMIASTIGFAGVNALVKWEVALYPVGEVAFFRSLFALVPSYLIALPRHGLGVVRTERIGDHIKRALSQLCSMTSIFIAFKLMPLAGAVAISFSAPLFTTLLSIVVLKERVGLHRWSALAIGFVGVLLVVDPGRESLHLGAVFALGNAIMISTVAVAIRKMSATESTETLVVYQISLLTLFTAALLPFGFILPRPVDFALLAAAGVLNGVSQYWWTKSLHLAPASAVVPFNYLALVWATIVGFLVWGDVPTPMLYLGSAIVVGSGLYILWRETAARRLRARVTT